MVSGESSLPFTTHQQEVAGGRVGGLTTALSIREIESQMNPEAEDHPCMPGLPQSLQPGHDVAALI